MLPHLSSLTVGRIADAMSWIDLLVTGQDEDETDEPGSTPESSPPTEPTRPINPATRGKETAPAKPVAPRAAAVPPPPKIDINGKMYQIVDLGTRSLRIQPYDGHLKQHQHFEFRLFFTFEGDEFDFSGHGFVRKISDADGLIAYYARPQPFFYRLLSEFLVAWRRSRGVS